MKASGALDCFSPLRLLRTEMKIKQKSVLDLREKDKEERRERD